MSPRLALLLALLAGCAGPAPAEPAPAESAPAEPATEPAPAPTTVAAPAPVEPTALSAEEAAQLGVGAAPDLAFAGALARHDGPLVIALTSLRCPIARLYAPGLADLVTRHGARLLVVDVAARDTQVELEEAARRHGWADPILVHRDADLSLARALQAQRTTEVFVLDAQGVLRYRGAIDDQYGQGYRRAAPRRRYLEDALRAVQAGEPVAVPATTAPGCALTP